MIIARPTDGRGLLYHVVDLLGQTVHAYRNFDTAIHALEGDQRIAIQIEADGSWLTDVPAPHLEAWPTPRAKTLREIELEDPLAFAADNVTFRSLRKLIENNLMSRPSGWRTNLDQILETAKGNLQLGYITQLHYDWLVKRIAEEQERT